MSKYSFLILKNGLDDGHLLWEQACREKEDTLSWATVDLSRQDWLQKCLAGKYDGLLLRPPAFNSSFKTLYDERVRILNEELQIPVYPSLAEVMIYENKKYFAYWLEAHQIPHPRTWVFYHQQEAQNFVEQSALPLVGKTNIGASGSGVVILRSKEQAREYIQNTFSGKGAAKSVGPKWRKKGFAGRVVKKMMNPAEFKAKMNSYKMQRTDVQKDFVILQEFVPHEYEWRCVRIADSFFAHKKIVKGEKASGHLIKGYDPPPLPMLDFVKEVTDKYNFLSQAVDIFETAEGSYLVNEMQCIFGQSDPYQMLIDGQPGRYVYQEGTWLFEAGDFNRIESFALRLEHFVNLIEQH